MKAKEWKSSLMLLLTAAIWGVAFVAQSVGMDYIGPFTFNAIRSLVGGLVLIPCIWLLNRKKPAAQEDTPAQNGRTLFIGGICCGVALAVASSLQQMGIQYTSVGKAGFITALYIVIVPLLGLLFKRRVFRTDMGRSGYCSGRHVPALHNRGLFRWKGRFAGNGQRILLFRPYINHRLFFPEGRWGEDVLHSIFGMRPFMRSAHADHGASIPTANSGGLDASYLCRRFQLRSGVYASDCGAAAY